MSLPLLKYLYHARKGSSLSFLLVSLLLMFVSITIDGYTCHQHQHKRTLIQLQPNTLHRSIYTKRRRYNISHRHLSTKLSSSITSNDKDCNTDEITQTLQRYGFGSRLVSLTNTNLPMIAEMYEGGNLKICLITGIKSPTFTTSQNKPPLLNVLVMNDGILQNEKVVDIGQITTLWQDITNLPYSTKDDLKDIIQSNYKLAQDTLQSNKFQTENAMQNLYNGRIANRLSVRPSSSRNNNNHRHYQPLTKKQIPKIVAQFSSLDNHHATATHFEELLRNLLKVGEDRLSRLVDSTMATDYLYTDYVKDGDRNEQMIRRMVAARILTQDAMSGGRFKRRSCQFVSAQYKNAVIDEDINEVEQVTLVNGGWVAVDPSIKAASEGRKFAAATSSPSTSSNKTSRSNTQTKPHKLTAADERIVHRLECLAMGDVWKIESNQYEEDTYDRMLELDVREALTSMNLPLTPNGATSALIQIGKWCENDKSNKLRIEPWSPELLDAARSLATYEDDRRELLAKKCFSSTTNKKKDKKKASDLKDNDGLEGRVDLTSLPCLCVDAKRASFRDDSIGVRLRSSTGRKVNKSASKWEILIHIADISDIYFDVGRKTSNNVHLLKEASEQRGQSRYDLPLGPLHLMPPVALTALSLATNKDKLPNRCVTLWAYIDERDGKLLEAGLERTLISSPRALTFADATTLLESNADEVPKSMSTLNAVISVAERNLSLWSKRHRQLNQSAQKREKRLATKERIAQESGGRSRGRDDGVGNSFQRSQGHRLVDSSLDLYSFALGTLVKRAKQPIPRAAGRGADRGGRLGTAPLRRYIDGIAQRQALSVLCGFGKPLTLEECKQASQVASQASDRLDNIRSSKQSTIQ